MLDLSSIKAVFFDFGDTLTTTIETYPKRIELSFIENGFSFTANEFINAYLRADYQIFKHYSSSNFLPHSEHQNLLYKFLTNNLKINENPKNIKSKIKNSLKEIQYKRVKLAGCNEILELLKDKGLKLAVISNNDGKTEEKCENVGIKNYFDIIIDSTKVKIVKPDKDIFNLALKKLNLAKEEVVHIGDLYGSDILGAMNAGLQPIWINHRNAENYESLKIPTVKNLNELISIFN